MTTSNYIVYNSTTGQIAWTGSCPDSDLSLQAGTGQGVISGIADGLTQYVDVSSQTVVSIPSQTDPATKFDWVTHSWVDDTANYLSTLSNEVRAKRDQLLANCDWTQVTDTPLNPTQKTAWAAYRQELRDIPTQSGFPSTVTYPSLP